MALVVGIDIGRKSSHDVIILRRETGIKVGSSFRFNSTPQGFQCLLKKLEQALEAEEPVSFVIDSPGRAWVPVVSVLRAKGYKIYRPTADKVKHLRRATNRKNKTNRIDAASLARTLIVDPEGTEELFLATGKQGKLDQLVRHREKLVDSIRRRKQCIQDMFEAINPGLMQVMGQFKFTQAGRAFLRRYADPRKVVRLSKNRLGEFLRVRYRLKAEDTLVDAIFKTCLDAVELYKEVREADLMPFDEQDLQQAVNRELDTLEAEERIVAKLDQQISLLNKELDPQRVLPSLPGIGDISAAGIRCCIGNIDRFDSITKHRSYGGLCPRVKKTGNSESAGLAISKMSSNRYKRYLYLAAENARKWDVEMASFYHKCRQDGHTHTQAVYAVANGKLLPRIHRLLKENKRAEETWGHRRLYVYKDLSGNPISKREAKAIIDVRWGDISYS
jgi:transposase